MLLHFRHLAFLLTLLSTLFSIISAVPNLYISQDANQNPQSNLQSYSGIIEFIDKSIPGDSSKMSDAQFINLAKVAYDEMVRLWQEAMVPDWRCPGAMIALESEGRIYFASSVRKGNDLTFSIADREVVNSVGWFQDHCENQGWGTHRAGGACAEPNVLRLYGDKNGMTEDDPPQYKAPPTTNTSPRMAVWARTGGGNPLQTLGINVLPCEGNNRGWGCERFAERYGLKPVVKGAPIADGEDGWQFLPVENPRKCTDGGVAVA
jgi:hypothetical protein